MTRKQAEQTTKPLPTPLAMSTASAEPTPSPIPVRPQNGKSTSPTTLPHPKPNIPKPKVRLEIRDLTHPGALVFFSNVNVATILTDAVSVVLKTLYNPLEDTADRIPRVRSITLVLRAMDGVAYTTGTELDDDHKEIHFSLDYISEIPSSPSSRQRDEITGVIVHEMVHVWQWSGFGTAPGGLIEGVADYVRLKAKLDPPHWELEPGEDWDAGYQHTAYFLDWLEEKYGSGTVSRINERLRERKYEEGTFWKELVGEKVGALWKQYSEAHWKGKGGKEGEGKDECVSH